MSRKTMVFFVAVLFNILCMIVAVLNGLGSVFTVLGSYIAYIMVFLFCRKLPFWVLVFLYIFVALASSLGSVLQLYSLIGVYDRIIHYLSGIILAYAGYYLFDNVLKRKNLNDSKNFLKQSFGFLLSCALASFWEMYEFTIDMVFHLNTQGDNFNTMGDIVAGVSGALTYMLVELLILNKLSRLKSPK